MKLSKYVWLRILPLLIAGAALMVGAGEAKGQTPRPEHPKPDKQRDKWKVKRHIVSTRHRSEQVEDLIKALTDILLNHLQISGFTYTQLTDIEQEVNGIYTYDRKLKFNAERLKKIFGAPAKIENSKER